MNPWGLLILGLGVLLMIMGVTGSYDKVKAAITGTTRLTSTTGTTSTSTTSSATSTGTSGTLPQPGTVQVA